MTEQPLSQAQDHDRRIGRLEGIAEQLTYQNRQTNARLDRIEQAVAEQGRQIILRSYFHNSSTINHGGLHD